MYSKKTLIVTAMALAAIATGFSAIQAEEEATPSLLGQMNTFEADIFQGLGNLEEPLYPREVANYVNRHLQKDTTDIQFASPADGVVHMACMGVNCYVIHVSVTVGQNGPVVWQGNQATGKGGLPCYKSTVFPCLKKDERQVAKEIVAKIERARQRALATEQ